MPTSLICCMACGSPATRLLLLPSISAGAIRKPVTLSNSGSADSCAARSGLRPPEPPTLDDTTRSPLNVFSTFAATDAFVDEAKMVMKPTRATPIINAAAVDDVRFGLRIAFCRANVPLTPFRRGNGAPSTWLIGRARMGPSTETPMKISSAPAPTGAMPAPPNRPAPMRVRRDR